MDYQQWKEITDKTDANLKSFNECDWENRCVMCKNWDECLENYWNNES